MTNVDTKSLKRLHKIAFGDSDAYTDLFFDTRYRPELSEIHAEGGEAVSAVYARILPFRLFGKEIPLPFLTGVATLPEARGKGLASLLLNRMAERLKNLGYPMVLLHPFNHDFYRRLGYTTLSYVQPCPQFFRAPNYTAKSANISDLSILTDLYDRGVSRDYFYRIRKESDWKDIFTEHTNDGGSVSLISKNGNPCGYFLDSPEGLRESLSLDGGYPEDFPYTPMETGVSGKEWTMGKLLDPMKFLSLVPAYDFAPTVLKIDGKNYEITQKSGAFRLQSSESEANFTFSSSDLLSAVVFGQPPFGQTPNFPLTIFEKY